MMATFQMRGDNYYQGQVAFNGRQHLLVGDNYQETYCNVYYANDVIYNDRDFDPERDMQDITCKRCRRAFEVDYFNWKRLQD
jgi:hypothetical protein